MSNKLRIRTVDSWIEVCPEGAKLLLAIPSYYVGPAVIEHNAFMEKYYPLPKGSTNEKD